MSKGRGLTEEERQLWRRVAARVKTRRPGSNQQPLAQPIEKPNRPARVHAPNPPAAPRAKKEPVSAPQDRGAERRVRRGDLEIDAALDLHGHNQDTGRAAVERFLRAAQARGDRTLVVVTGVGRRGEGVLKRRLPEWLAERDLRPLVSGFAQAHRTHGGAGAYYVFLRRKPAT